MGSNLLYLLFILSVANADIKAIDDYIYDGADDPWEGIEQPSFDDKPVKEDTNDYIEEEDKEDANAINDRYNEVQTNKPLANQFWNEWLKASSQMPDSTTTTLAPRINKWARSKGIDLILDSLEEEAKKLPKEVK